MKFSQDDIANVKCELALINSRYFNLIVKLGKLFNSLKTEKAKEYLSYGVMRRLHTLNRSVENIFSVFPIERDTLLDMNELNDVDINLHAFFVNVFGLLDNLAWVVIYEKQFTTKIDKKNVGLYHNKTQEHFTDQFCKYLNSDGMKQWHNEYLKSYRDSLAHRIPLYVPPKTLTPEQITKTEQIDSRIEDCHKSNDFDTIDKLRKEQNNIGDICHCFVSEHKTVVLHAQLIADFMTVEEIVGMYCEMFL